ncbi:alpha/beta fold hydrolase [Planctomonas psychrotolerans]|uniref:alpha/beta fold hydrolase n=1 Tax=Planctomonas psychrotolerans TaxID=2528712 RepID=UPI001238BEF9|nr:alpha/beta hydrolase [Planctomonas psychrotolerans]
MAFLNVGSENGSDIHLYYEDQGSGSPVVLVHGWPLSGRSWEGQVSAFVAAGHRVITYDRRGFGKSSQPWGGYDYDTFAADLHTLIETLDLADVTLVGFSMGGGELARYVGTYGTARIAKLVFASAVTPYLWKSENNPDGGVDDELASWFAEGVTGDRPAFLREFLKGFFGVGRKTNLVSDAQLDYNWLLAVGASPKATLDCTVAFATTDFRADLAKIDVPTLVIHGDSDGIVPFEVSGKRTHEAVPSSELVLIEKAPHGLTVTHRDEWNRHVLEFLAR